MSKNRDKAASTDANAGRVKTRKIETPPVQAPAPTSGPMSGPIPKTIVEARESRKKWLARHGLQNTAENRAKYAAMAQRSLSSPNLNPFTDRVARDWFARALAGWKTDSKGEGAVARSQLLTRLAYGKLMGLKGQELKRKHNSYIWQNRGSTELAGYVFLLFGNGPFDATELASFIKSYGLYGYCPNRSSPPLVENTEDSWEIYQSLRPAVVVLGNADWLSLALLSLVKPECCRDRPSVDRNFNPPFRYWLEKVKLGAEMIFYRSESMRNLDFLSQEAFLACFYSRQPPLEPLAAPWPEHAAAHPALQEFAKVRELIRQNPDYFPWPSTDAVAGSGNVTSAEWPKIGLLGYMGYGVGINGRLETERRSVLSRAFHLQILPKIESPEYLTEWGTSLSSIRLKKMADSVATFCRNAKRRRDASMEDAVNAWEKDLAWLKKTYYDGRFDKVFPWPGD